MKLFRKSRQDEKHHSHMMDPRELRAQQEYRMHQQSRHYEQQHQDMINQYEYVRREHGFDYMPPSQYVPSRSMSDDSEDISADPPIKIEVPGSDLSASVVESFDLHVDKHRKTPVVRGKPVKTKTSSRRLEKDQHMLQPLSQQYRSSRKHPVEEGRGADASSHYERDAIKIKSRGRSEQVYGEEDPSHFMQSSPEMASRSSRRGKTPKRRDIVHHKSTPEPLGYARHGETREHRSLRGEISYDDDPTLIQRVPTAFSYHSDDSIDRPQPKESRYGLDNEENEYRRRTNTIPHKDPSNSWERNKGKVHNRGRQREVDGLHEFTTPAYRSTFRREANSVPGRIIEAPRDDRMETHSIRRRSRDVREPLEAFEPPLGMDPLRHGGADELAVELSLSPYRDEAYFDDPLMEQGYYKGATRYPVKGRMKQETKSSGEKKKQKGLFGRIKDSVLKEKVSKRADERAWGQELREKGSLFEKSPISFDTDMSPDPHYHLDVPSARVPYPYDENYFEPSMRPTTKHAAPASVQPPRPRPRQESFDHRRSPHIDYRYDDDPEVRAVQPSGKPFQTSRATTPTLRANPDHRQRYVAMNTSMSKHYRSQHEGMGAGGHRRRNQSPGLQYDATQVKNTQRRKGFSGCN